MTDNSEHQDADIESMRLMEIKLHDLKNTDKVFTIFYDETNNIRKMYLTEDGNLNVKELNNFVLGGVAYLGENKNINLAELRSHLKLQDNVKELKLKNIAKGNFLDVISSSNTTVFLDFLKKHDLFLHYNHIDLLYWSIVDIIDSILVGEQDPLQMYLFSLKANLYEIIKHDLKNALGIMSKYNYPNLSSKDIGAFLQKMLRLIQINNANLEEMNLNLLKLLFSREQNELPFIQGYKTRELIDNFSPFYRQRLTMFKNATHIFDEEPAIVELFKEDSWINSARKGKFRFSTSEREAGIQLSDITVGLLGKMYSYLRFSDHSKIEEDYKKLKPTGIENLKILKELLDRTENLSLAFIHHCASSIDIQKSKIMFNM
jgi:hypothetical protein